jgi:DNA-binding NarL/FixJ family response regulator
MTASSLSSTQTPPLPDGRTRIFVVDDHAFAREWLTNFIDQQGDLYVCGQGSTINESLAEITRLQPEVVIVDLSLGHESGLDLIKRLQSLSPVPRVLVLSMHDEAFYAERALRAGALGYVMKRETTGKVIEGIRHVLRGEFYVSEPLSSLIAKKYLGRKMEQGGSAIEQLGDRELEVFRLMGQGHANRQIAQELHISLKTVQAHCEHIKGKLGIENVTALIREAVRWVESERRT